jgi:PAS domain S-box-containing protein
MVQSKRKRSPRKSKIKAAPGLPEDEETKGDISSPQNGPQEKPDSSEHVFSEVEDYAIMRMDLKGDITSWNRGGEKIKGYTGKEIIGKNYRIFYTSEDRQKNVSEKLLTESRKQGKSTYEGWLVKKDGTRFWSRVTVTALHDKAGKTKGYLSVASDLTEKRIAEDNYSNFVEELKLKNEELRESEERYRKMIAEVHDYAIILLDPDGKIRSWNKGAEKLNGYTSKEIIGKNFRLFYSKKDKEDKLPERLLAEAEKKRSVVHEGWCVRKGGTRFWASPTLTALHDDRGALIGFSRVNRDLTSRKVAEDRLSNLMEELRQANHNLKESEERYQKMVAEVKDYAIILLDADGNIENWNEGAQLIKGYTTQEIVGKDFRIFYSNEDRASGLPDRLIQEARRTGKVTHEGWRVRKDGSRFWGSVVITALHNAHGEVIGFSKVTRDLSERKLSDDALKSSAAQLDLKNKTLERLNAELASFTNVASHDLKEPLRKIQTFAGRIKDAHYDSLKSEAFVDKIIESSARMQKLIEDLLSFSEAGQGKEEVQDVNLNAIVAEVQTDLELLIADKKATIRTTRLPVVKGIRHQLHQLFLNLVANALKFSKPDVAPIISIESEIINGPQIPGTLPNGRNQYYHITVKDNGIGFASKESDKIFDPFTKLHPKNVYGGSGLGLSIVKKIVLNHNGIVTTESEPGVGSVFHIYVPRDRRPTASETQN